MSEEDYKYYLDKVIEDIKLKNDITSDDFYKIILYYLHHFLVPFKVNFNNSLISNIEINNVKKEDNLVDYFVVKSSISSNTVLSALIDSNTLNATYLIGGSDNTSVDFKNILEFVNNFYNKVSYFKIDNLPNHYDYFNMQYSIESFLQIFNCLPIKPTKITIDKNMILEFTTIFTKKYNIFSLNQIYLINLPKNLIKIAIFNSKNDLLGNIIEEKWSNI